jgi:hypothetical protein
MRRREFISFLGCGLVCPCVASAQQNAKQRKIGLLFPLSLPSAAKNLQAFCKNLEHLGHVEGRDIAIEIRNADGNFDRLDSLVAELVEQNHIRPDLESRACAYSMPRRRAGRLPSCIRRPLCRRPDRCAVNGLA